MGRMWVVGLSLDGLFFISSASSTCKDPVSWMHLSNPRNNSYTLSRILLFPWISFALTSITISVTVGRKRQLDTTGDYGHSFVSNFNLGNISPMSLQCR